MLTTIVVCIGMYNALFHLFPLYRLWDVKPFNCVRCMSFWCGVVAIPLSFIPNIEFIFIPLTLSYIIERYE